MRKIAVKEEEDLIETLVASGYSKTKVKQLIRHGAISINGRSIDRHEYFLSPGDIVTIRSEKEIAEEVQPGAGIEVVYEDGAIVVIHKPAGLLTIATEKEKHKTAYYQLNAYLRKRNPSRSERIFIIHRLDRDTSGLIVFAKSEPIKRKLQENWKEVEKKYTAIVEGVPKEKSGRVTSHLSETNTLKVYTDRDSHDARYSVTKYEVVKAGRGYSLLDVVLETGRKNQIRVHMADIGHPVAGDKKYGAKTDPLGRLALHACYLSFNHPVTGKRMEFRSTLPAQFTALIKKVTVPSRARHQP
jgi:23S rRNA pseudouridine1911/1915/1917 synthase